MLGMDLERLASAWEQFHREARAAARVLIIDDEPSVCMTLSAVLGAAGLDSDSAATLADARALLAARSYDLLVVDKNLPDGSGVVLIEEISSGADYVPSVMITGFPSATTVVDALTAGASDYVAKPFEHLDHLTARLTSVLDKHVSRRLSDRMVADLTRELTAPGGEEALVAWVATQLFTFKKDLARRPAVLLVEDNTSVAQVVKQTLEAGNLSCEVVGHLEAARAWLSRPDGPLAALVSVDLAEAVSLVRTIKGLDSRLEVVVTSGGSDTRIALEAVRAGASDYVVRSLESVEVLRARMQRAVGRSRRRHLHLHLFSTLYRAAQRAGVTLSSDLFAAAGAPGEGERWTPEDEAYPVEVANAPVMPVEEIDLTDLFGGEDELTVQVDRGARPGISVTVRTADEEDEALPLVEAEEIEEDDRRRAPRIEANLEVRFQVGGDADIVYGHLKNISSGGLFLPMHTPLEIGARLAIEIRPGWNVEPIQVVGEVVRQVLPVGEASVRPGVGVRLITGQTDLQRVVEGMASAGVRVEREP